MTHRQPSSRVIAWAALTTSVIALIVSASGSAGAAKHTRRASGPRAGQVVKLGKGAKIPASLLPIVAHARNADRVGGQSAASLSPSCSPTTVDLGTWCLMSAPYPLTNDQLGKNNYFFASQACVAIGGYLPTAGQLIGARTGSSSSRRFTTQS